MNNFFPGREIEIVISKDQERYNKIERKCLKSVFSNKIKVSFMFKVLSQIKKITNDYKDILKCYNMASEANPLAFVTNGENIEYDLCYHITGVHNFNMLLVEEHERGIKQESQKYIEEVANTVLIQVKLRLFGSSMFRYRKLLTSESYLYYPPVYSLFTLTNFLFYIYKKYYKDNEEKIEADKKSATLTALIDVILARSSAVLATIDYDIYECGYPILRSIIETYLVYLLFNLSNAKVDEYLKFNEYKEKYDAEFRLPEEFEKGYYKKRKDVNIISYLNYGWIDSIFDFEYLGIKKSYSLSDIVKVVNQLMYNDRRTKDYASKLEVYYKKCHYHSHSNISGFRFPIIYIMDLCKGLGEVLIGTANEIGKIFRIPKFENIDLVKYARVSVDKLHKIRKELNTEQLEKYYKNKKQ